MGIVDPQGKPIKSEDLDICPRCKRGPKDRLPSSGFGQPWTVCQCGYEFKEKAWPLVTS